MIKGRSDCRKDIVIVLAEESRQEQAGHRTTIHLYGRKGGKMSDRKKPYVVSQKDGIYYYLEKSGVRHSGWLQVNGKLYYFKTNGQMLTGF